LVEPQKRPGELPWHGLPVKTQTVLQKALWNHYLPSLIATVDTARRIYIRSLTIHLLMDCRTVSNLALVEKRRALRELVEYGGRNSVDINLENLSETAEDLDVVFHEVPSLCLTLDVGHANLDSSTNKSFEIVERLGKMIRHVHLHDNSGGYSKNHDLHLPIGDGLVDFIGVMKSLRGIDYEGTITLEVKPEFQELSRMRIEEMVEETEG